MGIPFYFASLIKSHRSITRTVKRRLEVDVLGVDFNCLIHRYLKEDNPVGSVVDAFAHLLETVCRPKHLLIAMDGVVPYAKIVQQRYRRMRIKTEDDKGFDRNQISPGTPYMRDLENALRAKFPFAILSSTLEEGEGEHKLFTMLRTLPESERRNVCIYGLDADLILICLQHFAVASEMYLLRESAEFNDPKLASAEFSVLNIAVLRTQIPLPVPQYVCLMVLCFGNDFMPNLGIFSLREGGYERALEVYEKAGNPDLFTFEGRDAFLDIAEQSEVAVLKERIALRRRPEEKGLMGRDGSAFHRQYCLHNLDGVQDPQKVVEAFWKTFHWTLHYFQTNTPLNWDWVDPYPDAPLLNHLLECPETTAEKGLRTFGITQQLQFILPAASLRASRKLVRFPDELHSETRHPWMKRHDWEMKPRISLPWHPTSALTEVSPL